MKIKFGELEWASNEWRINSRQVRDVNGQNLHMKTIFVQLHAHRACVINHGSLAENIASLSVRCDGAGWKSV